MTECRLSGPLLLRTIFSPDGGLRGRVREKKGAGEEQEEEVREERGPERASRSLC